MRFFERHDWVVSTLSPVHVGCGEDYEPTNYVVDQQGVLHLIDPLAMLRAGGEPLRRSLETALAADDPVDQMRRLHEALRQHARVLIPEARVRVPLAAGVLAHYRRTQDRRHDFNRNGIERTAYTGPRQTPYIPGSSLKGSMRTAWLAHVGKDADPLTSEVRENIQSFNAMIEEVELAHGRRTWRLKSGFTRQQYEGLRKDIEKALKACAGRFEPDWLGGGFEADPLRALKIGDAMPSDEEVEREVRFCINRSRTGRKTQAQQSNLYTRLEYILEHQPAAFSLGVRLHDLTAVAGRRTDKGKLATPMRDKLIAWDALVSACNNFYLPRLQDDLRVLRRLKPDSAWLAATQKVLDAGLHEDLGTGRALLLRVGKHTGADNNTVQGRQIRVMLNETECEERDEDGRARRVRLWVYDDAPRTSWYCADDLDSPADLAPHGWIVLSTPERAWLQAMPGHARRSQRRQAREREAALAAQKAEQERLQAEAEAAKAARLAAMSDNQRQIEAFIEACRARVEQLRGGRDRPHTTYHEKAKQLAKAALEGSDWTPEERRAAAEAIAEWLPKVVQVDMKEERKRLKLSQLRGEA
ncbi:MAG: type III-A CRISPR-associated RAMP protein Csm5 [Myxococcales bacterium]|nr:type III-A CRISPR-associated RAMP protein Csm5 [Myxococcota bacterium]MDW8284391.1 type III-A CRISPR-associated RAMP protein Csm5 [Myxococcales bacterium]